MQMMIAQDQRRASSPVAIDPVPAVNEPTAGPPLTEQVLEVLRAPEP